jgi:hypothetical protein
MKNIDIVFDSLDLWRHFPNYQLERRADIFFSLYLVEAMEHKLNMSIHPVLVPEFPVRIGTIYPNKSTDKSYKIDYVAFSQDINTAIFVELKTDSHSRRSSQDTYLQAAQVKGFNLLLDGLLTIFRSTSSQRKYFCLLRHLAQIGLLHIPEHVFTIMQSSTLQGINNASRDVKITSKIQESQLVYVQPNESENPNETVITFNEFSKIVARHDDPLSQRFAASLKSWTVKAGNTS